MDCGWDEKINVSIGAFIVDFQHTIVYHSIKEGCFGEFNYNTNYTKEQIEAILNTIKKCVKKDNHYTIARMKSDRRILTLSQTTIWTVKNKKKFCWKYNLMILLFLAERAYRFEHEVLYVFCPQVMLFNLDQWRRTGWYLCGFNIIDVRPWAKSYCNLISQAEQSNRLFVTIKRERIIFMNNTVFLRWMQKRR